jgi:hypothetical protein
MSNPNSLLQTARVHNVVEARALLKEWDERGEYFEQDIRFFSHEGKYLGTSCWRHEFQKHEELI